MRLCVCVYAAIFNPIPTAKIHDTQIYLVSAVVATEAAAAAIAAAHCSSHLPVKSLTAASGPDEIIRKIMCFVFLFQPPERAVDGAEMWDRLFNDSCFFFSVALCET